MVLTRYQASRERWTELLEKAIKTWSNGCTTTARAAVRRGGSPPLPDSLLIRRSHNCRAKLGIAFHDPRMQLFGHVVERSNRRPLRAFLVALRVQEQKHLKFSALSGPFDRCARTALRSMGMEPTHHVQVPFLRCLIHPSVRFRCNHLTTSRCPSLAAPSIASVVQSSVRYAWSHLTTLRWPLVAAESMAAVVQPAEALTCSHFTTSRCPFHAASSIAALPLIPVSSERTTSSEQIGEFSQG